MRRPVIGVAVAVAAVTTVAGYGMAGAAGDAEEVLGPGLLRVEVGIEHSQFSVDRLVVREGTVVELVVRNGDPIAHELVVGDDEVHERHATGSEEVHPPVPGEVSVGPGEDGLTFYEFDRAGTFTFACHLPRHVEYGMVGEVVVRP